MTKLEAALNYAAAGFAVIPLRGKIPRCARGSHAATTDESTIRDWWAKWPDADVGMTLAGLVVVDIDPRNGGSVDKLPPLPPTCCAATGDGLHFMYRVRNGEEYAGKFATGIDIKTGKGSYVVVAPSTHANGKTYAWQDDSSPVSTPPADAPAWLAL